MPKAQTKQIGELIAEQLGIQLVACQESCDTLHMYEIVDRYATVDILLGVGIVQISSRQDGVTHALYNIHVTLQKVDEIERPDWQQRVIDEERELSARLDKLTRFIETEAFNNLPPVEREDLVTQQKHMGYYQLVLRSRIARFTT